MLTKNDIRLRLNQAYNPDLAPETPYPEGLLKSNPFPAAVLIPMIQGDDGWSLLFIRRTEIPDDQHSGQVAFPGGRCDPIDQNAKSAALREAYEEVGIKPSDVEILGLVQDLLTITNYIVTPVVGLIPWPYKFTPQRDEVARIFTIPLNWLANPANREVQKGGRKLLGSDIPVIYFHEYDGEVLWGASARITLLFLEALDLAARHSRYI